MLTPMPRAALMRELADTLAHAAAITAQLAATEASPEAAPAAVQWVARKRAAQELGVHPDTIWTRALRLGVARNVGGRGGQRMVDLEALRLDARGAAKPP